MSPEFKARIGKGKPKGVLNKVTRTMKQIMEEAVTKVDNNPKTSLASLASDGKQGKAVFWQVASKLLPVQLTGDKANPIVVNITSKDASIG